MRYEANTGTENDLPRPCMGENWNKRLLAAIGTYY
jgi:hypothetical protein